MIVDRIWKETGQGAKYFCISTKSWGGKWEDHFFTRSEFKKIPAFLQDYADHDLYFCPHGFRRPHRSKEHAVAPSLLWSDMDEADPRKAFVRPTVAIESSPGRYVGLWIVDKPIDESVNRRLSYALGADVSGWDFSQVLRIPGTTNFKYAAKPRTRLLWGDGDAHLLRDIIKQLPPEKDLPTGETSDAAEVYRKWSGKMKPWLKRELTRRDLPAVGKRSEMLWKIGNALFELGMEKPDGIALLKSCVWNKFRGRRNEDERLSTEWEKATNLHFTEDRPRLAEENEERPVRFALNLDEVPEEDMDWVWYPFLARGVVSIIEGDPEAGKSYISQMICARVCNGMKLPCEDPTVPVVKGAVCYFDLENTAGTVTKKRMRWNGFESLPNFYQDEAPFSIDDNEALEDVYTALHRIKPAVLVFDTLNTYIGAANTAQGAEAQQSFGRFVELAKRFNCAVLVVRHLTKGSRDRAMYRGQGNIAFVGMARVVMLVGKHPEDPDLRVLVRSKGNLTRKPMALTYEIVDRGTAKERDRSELIIRDFIDLEADEVVSASHPKKDDGEQTQAEDMLKDALKDGAVMLTKLEKMAETRSISRRTLFRAADRLNVNRTSEGFGAKKKTYWELPSND